MEWRLYLCRDRVYRKLGNQNCKNNNITYKNYAISGSTITENVKSLKDGSLKPSVSEALDTMYKEYPDADYIVFEGGTNDADILENTMGLSRLGSVDAEDFSGNYDRTTFCGALESVFYRALKYWNGKKICFIVAQKMGYLTMKRAIRRRYFDKAVDICKKWGIPYIDLWEGCYLNPCLPWMYDPEKSAEENRESNIGYYLDGQHLTTRGYDFTAEIIEQWLKTL